MKKFSGTETLLITLTVLLIGWSVYMVTMGNQTEGELVLATKDQEITQEIHSEWIRADLRQTPPAIEIWYPSNWTFNCCGDKDTESNHFFFSEDGAAIVVTDYMLVHPTQGGTDSPVYITPEERMALLIDTVSPHTTRLQPYILEQTGVVAEVFQSPGGVGPHPFYPEIDDLEQPSRKIYLIHTTDDVFAITFENYEHLEDGFIEEFLGRIALPDGSRS